MIISTLTDNGWAKVPMEPEGNDLPRRTAMRQFFIEALSRCARKAKTLNLLGEYARAVYKRWNDYLWGELLIAPVIVWCMAGNPPTWVISLAFIWAFLIAGYYTWRGEYERLTLKLRLADPPFRIHDATTSNPDERRKYIQVVPEAASERPLEGCSAHLLRVMKRSGETWEATEFDHALPLRWSFYDTADPQSLLPGIEKRVNLLWFNNFFQMALETEPQVQAIRKLLTSSGTFRFDISIIAKDSPPLSLQLKIRLGLTAGVGAQIPWDAVEVAQV